MDRVKIRRLLWSFLAIPFLIHCNYFDGIPVIGIAPNGSHVQVFVPKPHYPQRLHATVTAIQDSTVPLLTRSNRRSCSGWMLRTVSFGVGVTTLVGIGPFQVGALPRFRAIFSNSLDPILP